MDVSSIYKPDIHFDMFTKTSILVYLSIINLFNPELN